MTDTEQMETYIENVDEVVIGESADNIVDRLEGGKSTAKSLVLAYLVTGNIELLRKIGGPAAKAYHQSASFKADSELDPDNPPEILTSTLWNHALVAIELATFAGNNDHRIDVAEDLRSWANRSHLDSLNGRKQNLRIDLTAGIAAVILGHDPEPHFETLRDHYEAMEEPNIYATRDRDIASAVEGIVDKTSDRVTDACRELDEYHEQLDSYDSPATEAVNIYACFCVAFARERGLDVTYTSEYVPESLITHYPLE